MKHLIRATLGVLLTATIATADWTETKTTLEDADVIIFHDDSEASTSKTEYISFASIVTGYLDAVYQGLDANLTSYAAITPSANMLTYLDTATFALANSSTGLGTEDSPNFTALSLGEASTTRGSITLHHNISAYSTGIYPGQNTGTYSMYLPVAVSAGENFLLNMDADGTMDYTDPASISSDNQTAAEVAVTTTNFAVNFANDASHDTVQELVDIVDDLVVTTVDISGATTETTIASDDKVIIYDTSASANRGMTRSNFVAGIGAGQAIILDIGDDSGNDSTDLGLIAISDGDTNSIFTLDATDKLLIDPALDWPKADIADTVTVTDDEATNEELEVAFVSGPGTRSVYSSSAVTVNPSSGLVTAPGFVGDLTGDASGSAATVTGAAQTAITSVGTLTSATSSGAITAGTSFVIGSADINETELEIIDGSTADTADLNIIDGISDSGTLTAAELLYVDGVTSALQGQIDAKADIVGETHTGTTTIANLVVTTSADLPSDVDLPDLTVDPADLADTDFGDFTVSDGIASLDLTGETTGDVLYYNGANWIGLAKGTAGQVLEMNAGATAPEWDTDDGAGSVSISGTPVANDFSKFTDGTTIVGRSYTETKSDLSLGNVDDTSDATKNAASVTLTNKTIAIGDNTVTGVVAATMGDSDHGDVAWLSNAAKVEDFDLAGSAEINGYDLVTADKISGIDTDVFIDLGADGVTQIASDTTIHLDAGTETLILSTGGSNIVDVATDTGVTSIDFQAIDLTTTGDIAATGFTGALTGAASENLPLAGGTLTGELVVDELGIEGQETDTITDCSSFSATGGGLFYDDSEGVWKKCQDNVLSVMDTGGGSGDLLANGTVPLSATWELGDEDLTGVAKLEGVDTGVFVDMSADGITQIASDNEIHLDANAETLIITDSGANSVTVSTDTGATGISFSALNLVTTGTLGSGAITSSAGVSGTTGAFTGDVTIGGTLQAAMDVAAADADGETIATADLNTIRVSSGAGDWDLPADSCDAATGNWLTVVANAAHIASITSLDTSDIFVLSDGTALDAQDEVDTAGSAWNSCTVLCVAANTWLVMDTNGACADGGAP